MVQKQASRTKSKQCFTSQNLSSGRDHQATLAQQVGEGQEAWALCLARSQPGEGELPSLLPVGSEKGAEGSRPGCWATSLCYL